MHRLAHTASHANVAVLFSHVFCCGLPAAMNVIALVAGASTLTATASWVGRIHLFMHQFELPLLLFSAVALIVGVAAQAISARRDCGAQACGHESCAPKKQPARWVLLVAGLLFMGNLGIYLLHAG